MPTTKATTASRNLDAFPPGPSAEVKSPLATIFAGLLCKTQTKRAATRPLRLPLPMLLLSPSPSPSPSLSSRLSVSFSALTLKCQNNGAAQVSAAQGI